MLTAAEKEGSWRLLFDIALSHGESLQCQRLTHSGFLIFVESAALVGASTGVFPALLEELWHRHCEPWSHAVEKIAAQRVNAASSSQQASAVNAVAFREEAREHGVVNFDGFADIMNVISVRCFQTHRCSSLVLSKTQQTLREAIALSAEPHVHLVESVSYTAAEYLKAFVHKNTVHHQTVIRLDPSLNGWTPHVKVLATHLVGSLHKTLLMPLFHRFAPTGQMNRTEYANFVLATLPPLNVVEEASSFAIFDYREFCHPNIYAKPLDDRLADAPVSAGTGSPNSLAGASYARSSTTSTSEAATMRTIGFDAFVDAVLMLGVVLYADERLWPRHRCISAKIWSIFEDHLCKVVPTAAMAPDPLFTTSHASVPPVLSLIYPARLPIDRLSVVLLGGLNITVSGEDAQDSVTTGAAMPPESTPSFVSAPVAAAVDEGTGLHHSLASSGLGESAPVNGIANAAPASSTTSVTTVHEAPNASVMAASVAQAAAALFDTTFEKRTYTSADTPMYGQLRCHTYVNEEEAASEMLCPNLAALHLPAAFWNTATFRNYISFVRTPDGNGDNGAFLFTPFRRVTVSLRQEDGVRVYASTELILEAAPSRQPLTQVILKTLESAFHAHCEPRCHGVGDDEGPRVVPATVSTRAFEDICRQLHLVSAATASLHCQTAIQSYWTSLEESRAGDETLSGVADVHQRDSATQGSTALPSGLSFPQFMCCIAHVCMKQGNVVGNVVSAASVDILQYLSVALSSSSSSSLEPSAEIAAIAPAAKSDSKSSAAKSTKLPHNGLREVPYQQAVALHRRAAAEGDARRNEVLDALRDVRSVEKTDQKHHAMSALSLIVDDDILAQELAETAATEPLLPAFPFIPTTYAVSARAATGAPPLVPLYAPDFTRSDATSALFNKMRNDFLRHEVVIKYP